MLLSVASVLSAQTPPPTLPTNVYLTGMAWSPSGTPSVDGEALYAHVLVPSTGTYLFTMVEALPNNTTPFTVNTNVGVGVAQRLFNIGQTAVYTPTGAGVSWTGANLGWAWFSGAGWIIPIKGDWCMMPNARLVKSSVSNGTGVQVVYGVMFGVRK